MKVNLPVINQEIRLEPGKPIVTKTDPAGIITYANDSFVAISGFSREELVGSNHNIVRHPDMPPEAFEDMWRTIGQGQPWRGIVKNRCKSGAYYWVEAFVTPLTESGRIKGYMSVRNPPRADDVRAAEQLYARVRDRNAALPRTPILPVSRSGWMLPGCALLTGGAPWVSLLAGSTELGTAAATLGSGLAIGFAWLLHHRYITPLAKLEDGMTLIREGRLTQRIAPPSGTLPRLFLALEGMRINLHATFADMLVSARTLDERSKELDALLQSMITTARFQSDRINDIAKAISDLKTSIGLAASNTEDSFQIVQLTDNASTSALEAMAVGIRESRDAAQVVSDTEERIRTMNSSVGRITELTRIIRDIADQTNLLALNAAIEAARAGEQGRGFAVVADEVRKLAERTAASTRDITEVIGEVIGQSETAVTTMGKAASDVHGSMERISNSSTYIDRICQHSKQAAQQTEQVLAELREQASVSEGVVANMEQLAQAVSDHSIAADGLGDASAMLRNTATTLRELVAHMENAI
ncbi:MAG: PAS domain S-box protein [Rhodocyclaceae bacterium]|nr:MAG: PAS domain S-box protein [Rhodocyclaceae bacterium]